MQPRTFEQAYCTPCRKPYRAVPAEYGLTVYVPDCFHGVIATDGTAPIAIIQPKG